jgi:putative transposase
VGKYASEMSGRGISEACPPEIPTPLEAFRELIERRKRSNKRIVRLRLFPNRYEQETLFDIGLACTRLWNELNYEKRNAFFNGELSPEKYYQINKKYYHKYKEVLGVNAQAVIQKNDEAWNAFFKQLDLRKQGRLPQHIRKVSPPGYWKDRLTGKKEIHIFVRSDRYYLEPVNEGEGYLVLVDFGLRIRYVGRIRWEGKQGRLEIIYINGRWFAHIPIEVAVDPPKSNKRGYVKPNYKDKKGRIVNPRSIKQKDPIGDKEAFMDMGA